jgi:nucleotide-binding universal stress UspA family protein
LDVETALPVGVPAVELADLAEETGASAIVVGSHGRSMLSCIFPGSGSMSLLHHATAPVLLVRMELCKTDEGVSCELQCADPFAQILFPTDFSEAAADAFERVETLAVQTGAKVTLLHAQNLRALDHEVEDAEHADVVAAFSVWSRWQSACARPECRAWNRQCTRGRPSLSSRRSPRVRMFR